MGDEKYLEKEQAQWSIDEVNRRLKTKEQQIFKGGRAEWEALPAADKAAYSVVIFTDDEGGVSGPVDEVSEGNMNAVTSNAVAEALAALNGHTVLILD